MFEIAVVLLLFFAVFDLIVGVSNDAVNFLNSSIGSRVAPRRVILIIASLGIIAGVTFSSGMMEIARKGIFHPQFFTMPELLTIFLAVMITDILLLDLFNTFGLPTSTTVSIVFELLGAAVAISIIKTVHQGNDFYAIGQYINSGKAMVIIFGILLSVIVAFCLGAIIQFFTRLLFTFDYMRGLLKYGALWGGAALTCITYFILVKGSKGASFITPDMLNWIQTNTILLLLLIFAASTIILRLLMVFKINILKPIILIGTFALAMAFAANDLVNFIGVPLAGLHAFQTAMAGSDPLTMTMDALAKKVQSETYLLLIAGAIMVITLWFSRKSRTVTETEISLAGQEAGAEEFESTRLSRVIVRMVSWSFGGIRVLFPEPIRASIQNRINPASYKVTIEKEGAAAFDLVRASVNLVVASIVISFATSLKLPLSTTYVTFMVAMGTSFSDQAWGRETAVYRVTGVLTVIGGWFMTAFMAFTIAFVFANLIFFWKLPAIIGLTLFGAFVIWRTHHAHKSRAKAIEEYHVFNLRKIDNAPEAVSTTFEHVGFLLREIRLSLERTLDALFRQDLATLRKETKACKRTQHWSNIITANVFKSLRLLHQNEQDISLTYAQTIRRLQKLADGHRDIVMRSYNHISNNHKGLLDVQIEQLREVKKHLLSILEEVENSFQDKEVGRHNSVIESYQQLRKLARSLNEEQIERIRDDTSKTRLSILFYATIGNAEMLSKQCVKLLEIFHLSFGNQPLPNGLDDDE